MQRGALAVAEDVGQGKDLRLAGSQQLLHREFGRGMEPSLAGRAVRADEAGAKAVQVGFVAGRGLQCGGIDLDEALGGKPLANGCGDARPRDEPRAAGGVTVGAPERRGREQTQKAPKLAVGSRTIHMAFAAEISIKRADIAGTPLENRRSFAQSSARQFLKDTVVRVIASSIRKGNIIERDDGQLCVVLSAESFHPGKGTPTTQIDMRRLSDGVKVTDRFKTTEQVERAFVEDKEYDFLYADGDGQHFMNNATYDQITVPAEVIGDQAQWLQEGMKVLCHPFRRIAGAAQRANLPPDRGRIPA